MDEQFEMREGMHNLTKEKISYLLETKNKTPWKNGRALYRRFHCHLGRESRQIEDRPGFQRRCKYKAMAQIEAPEAEKVELNKNIAVTTSMTLRISSISRKEIMSKRRKILAR